MIYGQEQQKKYKVEIAHKLAIARSENIKIKKAFEVKIQELEAAIQEHMKTENGLRSDLIHQVKMT